MIQKDINKNKVQRVAGEVQDFKIDPEAQIETLFRRFTEQYSYPIESLIREVTSNATDAHAQLKENCELAGVEYEDKPVIIKLIEKSSNKQIQFIDSGIGMSKDVVTKVYMEYLKTTKDKTNKQQGCFGMGAKTPMTYLGETPYHMITRFNGIELKYMFWYGLNAKNLVVPQSSLLSEKPTTEQNGTIISVPILEGDFNKFVTGINEQLPYFKNILFVGEGSELMVETAKKLNNYTLFEAETFVMRVPDAENAYTNHYSGLHAVIDQVVYPLNLDRISLSYKLKNALQVLPLGLRFDIGDLTVVDSREQLKYNDDNVKVISEKIDTFLSEIRTLYVEQKKNIKTLPEFIRLVDSKNYDFVINDNVSISLSKEIVGEKVDYSFDSFELESSLNILKHFAGRVSTSETMYRILLNLTFNIERVGRAVPRNKKSGLIPDFNTLSDTNQNGIFVSDTFYEDTDRWLKRYLKEDILSEENRAFVLTKKYVTDSQCEDLLLRINEKVKEKYHSIKKDDSTNYDELAQARTKLIEKDLAKFKPLIKNIFDVFQKYISDNVQNLQEYEKLNVTEDYKDNWKANQRAKRATYQRNRVEGVVFRNVSNGRTSSGQRVKVDELENWDGKVVVFEYKEEYNSARELHNEIVNIFGSISHNDYIGSTHNGFYYGEGEFAIIGCVANNFKHVEDLENVYTVNEFRKEFIEGKKDQILEALALSLIFNDKNKDIFPTIQFSDFYLREGFEQVDSKLVDYIKTINEVKETTKQKGESLYKGSKWFAEDYLIKYCGWDEEKINKRVANLAKRLRPSFKREMNYINKVLNKNNELLNYVRKNSYYSSALSDIEIEILKRGLK